MTHTIDHKNYQPAFRNLLKRLRAAKVTTKYIHDTVLPDWWEDDLASDSAGFHEAAGYIANALGLDIEQILEGESELRLKPGMEVRYKCSTGKSVDDLLQSTAIITRVVETVSAAITIPYQPISRNASSIRSEILQHPELCVNFENVLSYCWDRGIAVLSVTELPGKKPDGIAMIVGGRPTIVISKSVSHPAWIVFIIAHELGHIAMKHVTSGTMLLDRTWGSEVDTQEREANSFAAELLTGSAGTQIKSSYLLNGEVLAAQAKEYARRNCVDAGVVVLNYARTMDAWGSAQRALKFLPNSTHPHQAIRTKMLAHLEMNKLSREQKNWLLRATNVHE